MIEDFTNLDAGIGFRVKHPPDKGAELLRAPFWTPELSGADLPVHGHEVAVVERQVAGGEHEEHDAAGPHVRLAGVVPPLQEDLRRDVGRGAAVRGGEAVCGAEVLVGVGERAEPEVREPEVAALVEEEVLRLDVAMEHAEGVRVRHRGGQLREQAARRGLVVVAAAAAVERGQDAAAAGELEDEVDGGAGGEHVEERHHVRVAAHAAERGDLPLHLHAPPRRGGRLGRAARRVVVRLLLLADGLDGDVGARAGVARAVHLGGGALAEHAAELVPALQDLLRVAVAGGRRRLVVAGRWHLRRREVGEESSGVWFDDLMESSLCRLILCSWSRGVSVLKGLCTVVSWAVYLDTKYCYVHHVKKGRIKKCNYIYRHLQTQHNIKLFT